jgi:hypothetical protein
MSYKFGQFRKSQLSSYLTPLEYTLNDLRVQSSLSEGITFIDKGIDLEGNNILQALTNANKQRSYYIRFKIFKQETIQKITVRLINTEKSQDNVQTIETIEVPIGKTTDYSTFELILSPNDNHTYNQIYFELNRELIDYNTLKPDGTYGREMNISIDRLDEIYNVIDFLNTSIENKGTLKQIGVQGPPGLLMSINGEAIRIGRSGLYEINNGINTTFIGFIVEADEKYFILDYQY